MASSAVVNTITSTAKPPTATAKQPHRHGSPSRRPRRRVKRTSASIILQLFLPILVPTTYEFLINRASLCHAMVSDIPSSTISQTYERPRPWPPPSPSSFSGLHNSTQLKTAITNTFHPTSIANPHSDPEARSICSSEKFSLGDLGHTILGSPCPPILRAVTPLAESLSKQQVVLHPNQLILLQNTLFCSRNQSSLLTMTTRPSCRSPSSLLAATQASAARTRSSSQLKKARAKADKDNIYLLGVAKPNDGQISASKNSPPP